jgi:hypothetical protein
VALTQLEPVTAVHAQLEVSIKKGSSHQDQIQEFGFVFDQGTSLQKVEVSGRTQIMQCTHPFCRQSDRLLMAW